MPDCPTHPRRGVHVASRTALMNMYQKRIPQWQRIGDELTNWILDIMEDSGPYAYTATS